MKNIRIKIKRPWVFKNLTKDPAMLDLAYKQIIKTGNLYKQIQITKLNYLDFQKWLKIHYCVLSRRNKKRVHLTFFLICQIGQKIMSRA